LPPFPLLQYRRLLTRNRVVRSQKPTKADAQNVVQIVTNDKVKTQAYCDLNKLEGEVKAAAQTNDTKTLEALSKQAESPLDKLGPNTSN
jgi:mevalonate kinase